MLMLMFKIVVTVILTLMIKTAFSVKTIVMI